MIPARQKIPPPPCEAHLSEPLLTGIVADLFVLDINVIGRPLA